MWVVCLLWVELSCGFGLSRGLGLGLGLRLMGLFGQRVGVVIGSTWAFASAIGSVVGGAVTEREMSWRWCFFLNIEY